MPCSSRPTCSRCTCCSVWPARCGGSPGHNGCTEGKMRGIDILMITYDRPEYVRLSLPHLLDSCTDDARVWLWHNGTDAATLAAVEEFRHDPRVHRFHHSPVNAGLREPTN